MNNNCNRCFLYGLFPVALVLFYISSADTAASAAAGRFRKRAIYRRLHANKNATSDYMLPPGTDACVEKPEFSKELGDVFCRGKIVKTVHAHQLFKDEKEFVDSPLTADPADVLRAFDSVNASDAAEVRNFLSKFFSPPGTELELCVPEDWKEPGTLFPQLRTPRLRKYAEHLHQIWKNLCRKIKDAVYKESNRRTLINVPNVFIIPGGRFKEFYYWDNYWIVKGLIASNMTTTAAGMIRNMIHMVKRFGFVPNGGRMYYLRRSQPPTLALTVKAYYDATRDKEFLREVLPTLEDERRWWDENRAVEVAVKNRTHRLYRYLGDSNAPRPESYGVDARLANEVPEDQRPTLLQNVAAAAESGWDFSSRWFEDRRSLSQIFTTRIVPVDLNALLCSNSEILTEFYRVLGKDRDSTRHSRRKKELDDAIEDVMWNDNQGSYFDYWLDYGQQNVAYYASNFVPLYTRCGNVKRHVEDMYEYLKDNIRRFPYGVPMSRISTGEQWDFPNSWAPNVHMVIEGLRLSAIPRLEEEALKLAKNYVEHTEEILRTRNAMFEKYRVDTTLAVGYGGEYDVQEGFGWTNGVVLDFMSTYGDRLASSSPKLVFPVFLTIICNLGILVLMSFNI